MEKESLTMALRVLLFFMLVVFGIMSLVKAGMYMFPEKPETKTTEQIKYDRYANCIKFAKTYQVLDCKNYLE